MNNQYRSISVTQIITRYMIRYNTLHNLINFAFKGSSATQVNIYVDLYCLYRTLFSRHYMTEIGDYRDFTVGILDLCAHYRSFFKYLGVYSKFFLISSHNLPKHNLQIIPNYNKEFQDKLLNTSVGKMVDINTELLDLLCPYLPDIHFLKTEFESCCLINELIQRENIVNPKCENIILSTDELPMQILPLYDNISYLYPIKSRGADDSNIICNKLHSDHRKSFWNVMSRKLNYPANLDRLYKISSSNLMLLMSLNQIKSRYLIPCVCNISMSSKIITEFCGASDLRVTPELLFEKNNFNLNSNQIETTINRFKCVDLHYQNIYFQESLEPKTLHYENLEDPDTIQLINSQYFTNNPIDIFRL